MDPLTALGVASNVVQLLTFAGNLLEKGREVYRSADGALVENNDLETTTKTLEGLSERLIASVKNTQKTAARSEIKLTAAEEELKTLCEACQDLAQQLLDILVKLKQKGNSTKWKSLWHAISCIWSEEEIKNLSQRLEQYRRQLDTVLLVILRERIDRAQEDNKLQMQHMSEALLGLRRDREAWESKLVDAIYDERWKPSKRADMEKFSARISIATAGERNDLHRRQILELLRFHEITDRYDTIARAHRRTFEWIFEQGGQDSSACHPSVHPPNSRKKRWDSFVQWIQGSSSLYWITGKPGSGKSTLMKYLYNDPRVWKGLQRWSAHHELVSAGFFFWNSGKIVMQMSMMGLLRSILYQVLKERQTLIQHIFPRRWNAYELFGGYSHEWSWTELVEALEELVKDDTLRFAFFIDGLDEFSGDSSELCQLILRLTSRKNIKLCVASRPWLAFEEAFDQYPRLRVENLTADDIMLVAFEKLNESPMFVTMEKAEPRDANNLILDITSKAEGVFLWVRIVVHSLLDGLRDGDSMETLQATLRSLPSDLEDLFRKILNRYDPKHFREVSKMFQLMAAAKRPLALLDLSYALDGFEKAMSEVICPITSDKLIYRVENMRRRLMSRTKGLLEVPQFETKGGSAVVSYLHRTVRDFLAQSDNWNYILSGTTGSLFNPSTALLAAYLMLLKSFVPHRNMLEDFWGRFYTFVFYLREAGTASAEEQVLLFEELHKTSEVLWQGEDMSSMDGDLYQISGGLVCDMPGQPTYTKTWLGAIASRFGYRPIGGSKKLHWTDTARWIRKDSRIARLIQQDSNIATQQIAGDLYWFPVRSAFGHAFRLQLKAYIIQKLDEGVSVSSCLFDQPLLLIASLQGNYALIETLLSRGADPNQAVTDNTTVWEMLKEILTVPLEGSRLLTEADWAPVMQLFLGHGAKQGMSGKRTIGRDKDIHLIAAQEEQTNTLGVIKRKSRFNRRLSKLVRKLNVHRS